MTNKSPPVFGNEYAQARKVSLGVILGFSVGSLGTGIYSSVPSVLLLFYMTDTLSIAPSLAAMAFFLPKIWDVITDPVMGVISDHTKSKMGRRRPYLLLGSILMSLTFVGLFNVPTFEASSSSFLYILIVFILSATSYTVFAVPYIAMPAEMSEDHHERTVIMSYRMGFAMAGILIGSAFAPYIVEWAGGGRQGYASMSVIIGLVCAASMLLSFFATRSAPQTVASGSASTSIRSYLSALISNKPFCLLMLIYVLQLAAMGIFTAAIPYFVTYILNMSVSFVGTLFFIMLGSAILTMVMWTFGSKFLGKKNAFALAAVIFAAGIFSLTRVDADYPKHILFLQFALIGVGLAGIQMLPFSMLTDAIRIDRLTTGAAREGVFTGFWTASEKLGLALGPLFVGLILSIGGFEASSGDSISSQSDSALFSVRFLAAMLPSVVILISALLITRYPLTEETIVAFERQ